jgi:NADH dehydrogenase
MSSATDVVTGAFSYSGQYITRRLLAAGRDVRTLTGHPDPTHPLAGRVAAHPYNFHDPDRLVASLRGADTLYNTYWVRFPHGGQTYDTAVANLRTLIGAAARAGMRKIVHTSIINPAENSPYAYFRGKAAVERIIRESGLRYTILRPTVVFGPEDILINNIAWMLRKFPVFLMPGDGSYRIQPIHVEDLARLAARAGATATSEIIDASGPEVLTYREMVESVGKVMNRRVILAPAPAALVYAAGAAIGWFLRDVILTYEEILALKDGILYSAQPATGTTSLSQWLEQNAATLGRRYRSEVARHFKQQGARTDGGETAAGPTQVRSVLG